MSEERTAPAISPETQDQIDRLLRLAHIAANKGDRDLAQKHLDEAEALAPESPDVLVAIGDALLERKQLKKAHDVYAKAHELDPTHVDAERKFGETLLRIKEVEFAFLGGPDYISPASGKSAVIFSIFIPGLGHYVLGEEAKGGIVFGIWLLALLSTQLFGGLPAFMGMFGGSTPFNPLVLIPIGIAFLAWAYGVAGVAGVSKKIDVRPIDRPVPPVDKPFEL